MLLVILNLLFVLGCSTDTETIQSFDVNTSESQEETAKIESYKEETDENQSDSGDGSEQEDPIPEVEQVPKSVEEIDIFPKNHPLNTAISNRPIDENSDLILANIGLDVNIFADFGSGTYLGEPMGVPYVVVNGMQPRVPITFRQNSTSGNYGHESDQGPFPIPLDAPIEADFSEDGHVIAVDVDNQMLYELYNADQVGKGFDVSSAAVFDLKTIEYRPDGWTSADAAGLPIFPLLIRYSEVETGEIDHAIRFSLSRSKIYEGYVHPARHLVNGKKEKQLLPFGGRLRLKADFDISGYSLENQVILRALKKYGLMLADVGRDMFMKGNPHEKWNNIDLRDLRKVKISDFDVVELGEIKVK